MALVSSRQAVAAAASLLWLLGCAVPVENPPAYDAERNLCRSAHADEWDRMLEDCRERYEDDASCGGLISFTGQLEGQALTVDSELGAVEFNDWLLADGSELRGDVKVQGRSPYFLFTFEWRGLGGPVADETEARTLAFGGGAGGREALDDEAVRGALRMSVGGETKAFAPRAGQLKIERQSEQEQVASFEARFGGAGDRLDGCFHAFVIKHSLERDDEADDQP